MDRVSTRRADTLGPPPAAPEGCDTARDGGGLSFVSAACNSYNALLGRESRRPGPGRALTWPAPCSRRPRVNSKLLQLIGLVAILACVGASFAALAVVKQRIMRGEQSRSFRWSF